MLENGANADAQDIDGLTPSMAFAQRLEQDKEMETEMEMELGRPLPPEEGKNRERLQALFAGLHKKWRSKNNKIYISIGVYNNYSRRLTT